MSAIDVRLFTFDGFMIFILVQTSYYEEVRLTARENERKRTNKLFLLRLVKIKITFNRNQFESGTYSSVPETNAHSPENTIAMPTTRYRINFISINECCVNSIVPFLRSSQRCLMKFTERWRHFYTHHFQLTHSNLVYFNFSHELKFCFRRWINWHSIDANDAQTSWSWMINAENARKKPTANTNSSFQFQFHRFININRR